jgi:acyl carrier protein
MPISSRTPEGHPSRCRLCGAEARIEFSEPPGDAVCPQCGCLLWKVEDRWLSLQNRISEQWGVAPELITPDMQVSDLLGKPGDSLDAVELVMALEEEFDLNVPDHETLGDAVRYIEQRKRER